MALALGVGASGAIWVIFRADVAAILQFEVGKGEVIYFWGCVAHAVYTPLVARLNRGEAAIVFTFGTLVAGAAILTVVGWSEITATPWMSLPAVVWFTLLYTAIFASAATFTLLQFAALRLPSAKVMAYTYLTPTWVIGWQIALGDAFPPLMIWFGIGLTGVAIYLLLKNSSLAQTQEEKFGT